jgi:hypothetical protein
MLIIEQQAPHTKIPSCGFHKTLLIAGKFSSTAFAVCCTAGVVDDVSLRTIDGSLMDAARYAEGGGGQPSANSFLSLIATGPATHRASLKKKLPDERAEQEFSLTTSHTCLEIATW